MDELNETSNAADNVFEYTETPPDKTLAMQMARDTIARINAGKFTPTYGTYLRVIIPEDDPFYGPERTGESLFNVWARQLPFSVETDAQSVIDDLSSKCTGCAKGALFISYVALRNEHSVKDVLEKRHPDMLDYLGKAFTEQELDDIEGAFEQFVRYDGLEGVSPTDRLLLISEYIANHEGTFNYQSFIEETPQELIDKLAAKNLARDSQEENDEDNNE